MRPSTTFDRTNLKTPSSAPTRYNPHMRLSITLPTPPPPAGTPVTATVRCPDAAFPANPLGTTPLSTAPATALCAPATAAYEGVVAAGRVVFPAPQGPTPADKDAWRRPPAVRYTPTLAVPFNPPAGSVVEARARAADKTYTAAALVPAPDPAHPNTTAADLTINLTLREGATAPPTPPPGPAPQPADGLIISPLTGADLEDGDAYTLDTAPGADRIVVVQ